MFFSFTSIYAKEEQLSVNLPFLSVNQNFSSVEASPYKSVPTVKKVSYAIVTASALNLRSGPGTNNHVLKILPEGTHLLFLATPNKTWMKVRIPDSISGWVAQKHIKIYQPQLLSNFRSKTNSTLFKSRLEASIVQYMKEVYASNVLKLQDKLSIVVQDLTSSEFVVSIQPRLSVKSASTIKVSILHAYMLQRFRGNITHSNKHQKLLEEMIRFSSNQSTNAIIKLLGGTQKIQQLLNQTKKYNELSLREEIPEDGRTYLNKISALDLNNLFVNIWFQRLFGQTFNLHKNEIASKEMLNLLGLPGHSWLKDRIKAETCFSTNNSVKLWDKTGFVKGANGNAGIVEIDSPHGRKAYSIVLFIEREDYQTIKGDAAQWFERTSLRMRRISEMTYAFFANRYQSYNKCGLKPLIHYAKLALSPLPMQASF